jgi:nicotinate phosphoribosyltransferase
VLGLREEAGPEASEPMLVPVMREGRRLAPSPQLAEARLRFQTDIAHVPRKARRLTHPEHVLVPHSPALRELTDRTRDDAERRSGNERGFVSRPSSP